MIFIKNIIKKKNFKGYIISFVFIIFVILLLHTLYLKIEDNYKSILNKEEYRTITVFEIINIDNQDIVESVTYEDNITYVVLKDYSYVDIFLNSLDEDTPTTFMYPPEENEMLYNTINILIIFISISLSIVIIIYITQFINDDKDTINILHDIGYDKYNILYRYLKSFILIFILICIISFILILLINIYLKQSIINIILYSINIFILYLLLLILIITIKILSIKKI